MSNSGNHNSSTVAPKAFGVLAAELRGNAGDTPATTSPIRHIYVHIPFCARICPYCAFYKDLLDRSQTWRFCEAILRELELYQGGPICKSSRRTRDRRSLLLPSTITSAVAHQRRSLSRNWNCCCADLVSGSISHVLRSGQSRRIPAAFPPEKPTSWN